jgi:hypothetical protein
MLEGMRDRNSRHLYLFSTSTVFSNALTSLLTSLLAASTSLSSVKLSVMAGRGVAPYPASLPGATTSERYQVRPGSPPSSMNVPSKDWRRRLMERTWRRRWAISFFERR